MNTSPRSVAVAKAIAGLYHVAEMPDPTADACITPLSELIRNENVICTELANLSVQTAMSYLLKRGGLAEPFEQTSTEPLAGFIYANSRFGSIFVEKNDLLVRRRFSIAHELGHYLLHFQPLIHSGNGEDEPALIEAIEVFPLAEAEESATLPKGEVNFMGLVAADQQTVGMGDWELEANQFAVELLMPAQVVSALATRYATHFRDEDLVWRLATEMLVSRAAMRWRLRELGLVAATMVA